MKHNPEPKYIDDGIYEYDCSLCKEEFWLGDSQLKYEKLPHAICVSCIYKEYDKLMKNSRYREGLDIGYHRGYTQGKADGLEHANELVLQQHALDVEKQEQVRANDTAKSKLATPDAHSKEIL